MSAWGAIGSIVGGVGGFLLGGPVGAMAGASILGGAGGAADANSANAAMAREAGQFNLQSAREQMAFQKEMSSTAHQREVEDLKKAGLNPILSANAGASTPSGASATMQPSSSTNVLDGMAASALQAVQLKLAMTKQASEINLMNAQANKAAVDAKVATKGIPEADLKNQAYDLVRPLLKKIRESNEVVSPRRESGGEKVQRWRQKILDMTGQQKPINMKGPR